MVWKGWVKNHHGPSLNAQKHLVESIRDRLADNLVTHTDVREVSQHSVHSPDNRRKDTFPFNVVATGAGTRERKFVMPGHLHFHRNLKGFLAFKLPDLEVTTRKVE
jgi:hypothetical protein